MITRAPNWRGTAIRAIAGTRGLSSWCGMGADAGPDTFTPEEIAALVGPVGPDANIVAPLQIGQLAQSAAGLYSINPQSGQLVQNIVPGVSNRMLVAVGAGLLGLAVFLGMARGRR